MSEKKKFPEYSEKIPEPDHGVRHICEYPLPTLSKSCDSG